MKKKFTDRIFVVDLEATCWNGNEPLNQCSDIIEIGLCTLDVQSGELGNKESFLVKPTRSDVSPFCTMLTSITQEMLRHTHPLPTVTNTIINKYHPQGRIWAGWGEWDRIRLEKECKQLGAQFPFGGRYLNVKTLFAISKRCNEKGLAKAIEMMGWEFEGTHHRGHDDAWNTARILKAIMWPKTAS